MTTTYERIRHAAHTGNSGWDLERWDLKKQTRQFIPRQCGIPIDAEYHSGYVDSAGEQHWVFVRKAPLSGGPCDRCAVSS